MAKTQRPKTLAEQIADLDDPTPRDFDPEDHGAAHTNGVLADSESEAAATDDDGVGGREHYVDVGKSTLRGPEEVVLGARYEGTSVGRDALMGVGVGVDEESDDDPFGSGASRAGGGSEEEDGEEEDEEVEERIMDVDGELGEKKEEVDEDEDIDSDEAFGEGDGERFKGFSFRGSKRLNQGSSGVEDSVDLAMGRSESEGDSLLGGSESGTSGADELDASSGKDDIGDDENPSGNNGAELMEEDDDENEDVVEDDDEDGDKGSSKAIDDRAELRKMMAEEQKSVASTISQAAKADVEKGNAVKHQRSTFDSLLNTRIGLQNALIATNSIPTLKDQPTAPTDPSAKQAILAAEEAAINLWSQLDTLRHTLTSAAPIATKRKSSPDAPPDPSIPTTTLWRRMQSHESISLPTRRSTLEKWSTRLRPASALSSSRNLLRPTPSTQPLTSVLDHHLADMPRLVAHTHTPRSCAPLQAQAGVVEARDVYDDADFYTVLLRELVDQRMADSVATAGVSAATTTAAEGGLPRREGRLRKKVDTKASKGRKMRYTVHEKLQNFMASEDRGSWGDRQRDELFEGLLGRRAGLREEDEEMDGEDAGDGEEEGLRLFRS